MDEFLSWLFPNAISATLRLLLFTLPERSPRFYDNPATAEAAALEMLATQNVYFGVGLIQGTPRGRGMRDDIGGIGALWADVDFAGPAHSGKPLPTGEADFERLLAELPLPPSIVIDSGFGRHLYWLLEEPWLFADAEDRQRAAQLAHAWHEVVCVAARRLGWSLENLGDLTRILRLPGTLNHKQADAPREVRVLNAHADRRYAIADFETVLPEQPHAAEPHRPVLSASIEIAGEPPADKLQAALNECPMFRSTWERERTDMADQSASAYDLSLATIAVLRGWSNAEIAALLVAWRSRHGERPEKATRPDYLARTLARARDVETHSESPVDLSHFLTGSTPPGAELPAPECPDPGPLPESLCHIPGFIENVMELCLTTAPYPNVPLAFCGALALQALLAGRKVRDEADNRTNIYLLALAYSAVGKDWPRKVNTAILHRIGLVHTLGEKFASGEGIQDALSIHPALLFQTDEIDGLLQSINKSRDARHESILSTLLTMYSSANTIYPMRRKASREAPGVIDQPCLVVYGTAIPTHYYGALSERMLTNGFFARMLIVESGPRSPGQDPGLIEPSSAIIDTAQWWADFNPTNGNLGNLHPQPRVVEATAAAQGLLRDGRLEAEGEYSQAEMRGDPIGTTVWGRANEQTRKLALLYAASANHSEPVIDEAAVRWANAFVQHQIRRMLFMAHGHVAENPFHAECLKLLQKLREAPERQLPHSVLLKRMKLDSKTFQTLTETLVQQGDIEYLTTKTAGRPSHEYRLRGERRTVGERSPNDQGSTGGEISP